MWMNNLKLKHPCIVLRWPGYGCVSPCMSLVLASDFMGIARLSKSHPYIHLNLVIKLI